MAPATLCVLPLEIIDSIAFELSALSPLGPPSSLVSFLRTCTHLCHYLSSDNNPALYARIFKYKFDTSAVQRRAFRPSHVQCVDQLKHYCRAMKVLRRGDVYACPPRRGEQEEEGEWGDDNDAGDAMFTAFMMMLEDDGRNWRQLVEWARADVFVEEYVRRRLYEGRERNEGWPVESMENACAVWLMWMFTTQQKLENEEQSLREAIIGLLLPFVLVPYRYSTSEAPPNHYHLPLSPSHHPHHLSHPHTIPTPHGPYPLYPSPRATSQIHFSTRPLFSPPLIAPAAKLLYFARREVVKFPIPPHLARDRHDAHARGNFDIGPTRDDVHEANWGWTARLPGGSGVGLAWGWGVGDGDGPSTSAVSTPGPASTPASIQPVADTHTPARWAGKAPHSRAAPGRDRSRRWDMDWWRLRLCGNTTRRRPRIPYGRVYEPGCMDGLWQGRMLTPAEAGVQNLLGNPLFPPPDEFNEGALSVMTRPIFLRMSEVHGVYGDTTCPHEGPCKACADAAPVGVGVGGGGGGGGAGNGGGGIFDDGMSNAWFPGETGSVDMRAVSDSNSAHGRTSGGGGAAGMGKKVAVSVAHGRTRAFYRAWEGRRVPSSPASSPSTGSPPHPDSQQQQQQQPQEEEEEWPGYPHPPHLCPTCTERAALLATLRREEREMGEEEREGVESVFAGVGLGRAGSGSSSRGGSGSSSRGGGGVSLSPPESLGEEDEDEEDEEDTDSDEEEEDDWEDSDASWDMKTETQPSIDPSGRVYPPAPPAHDRRKLALGTCDGVREVLLFGETDERHGQAWNHYTFYGRVRPWDGLIGILRKPRNPALGYIFFYGYIVGGENFVGNWRITSADPTAPVWESAFSMSRRDDA